MTEQLELDLVALKDASQEEIVQRIFRNFHTIKGNANFFNSYSIFAEIAKIAHAAEDMMSKIRKGEQPVTTSWMNGVLAAFDCLKSLLEKAEQGERNVEEQTSLLNRLYSMLNSPQKELSNSDNKTVQNDSIKEQITVSQTTNVALDTSEKNDSQNTNIANTPIIKNEQVTKNQINQNINEQSTIKEQNNNTKIIKNEQVTKNQINQNINEQSTIKEQNNTQVSNNQNIENTLDSNELEEVIGDFLNESHEIIEQLEIDLVALSDASQTEIVQRIFRNFHTIKGNANFFNAYSIFAEIAKMAHVAEDMIGKIQQGTQPITTAWMNGILAALDCLKFLFEQAEKGTREIKPQVALLQKLQTMLNELSQIQKSKNINTTSTDESTSKNTIKSKEEKKQFNHIILNQSHSLKDSQLSSQEIEEILQDFLNESNEIIEQLDKSLILLEKEPTNTALLDQIFRSWHTLKSNTAFLGFSNISNIAHTSEDVLKEICKGNIILSSTILEVLLQSVDYFKNFFQKLSNNILEEGDTKVILQRLQRCITPTHTQRYVSSFATDDEKETSTIIQKSTRETKEIKKLQSIINQQSASINEAHIVKNTEQTIRVDSTRLDALMNLAGELVLGRNRLNQVMKQLEDKLDDDKLYQEIQSSLDLLNFVTTDLQNAVLKTRMQPIGKIFNRFHRTVRDLAHQLGKEITLVVEGEETELDKTVIDELGEPLTHMLRNSIDHGIETPDIRKKNRKPITGTISLTAYHQGNHIIITVQDDGKGMSRSKIQEKAIQQGLISATEAQLMSDQEIQNLIFMPGFSTAEKVTNVSGRGVGMDVVKTSIEKLHGSVEIHSQENKGTIFVIRLPFTLAIIHTLQVKIAEQIFAIPLHSIVETLRFSVHKVQTISGMSVIDFREQIIPLIYLSDFFDLPTNNANAENIYIVVAEMAEKKVGLVVDDIIGQEEVVVKSMGKLLNNTPGISSACIRGDGKVTLIIDLAGIFKLLPYTLNDENYVSSQKKSTTYSKNVYCVLIVEDSRSERKRTKLILESQKCFKIIEAMDGKDALNKIFSYPIDLVLTDIEMPEFNGYQLTSKIREYKNFKHIPVIAISSHKEMIDRIRGMEAGITLYLSKPFQEEDLLNAIKTVLS